MQFLLCHHGRAVQKGFLLFSRPLLSAFFPSSTTAPIVSGTSTWFPFVIVFAFCLVVIGGVVGMAYLFFRRPSFLASHANSVDFPHDVDDDLSLVELDGKHGVNFDK
jgi:hypothetical protein